MNVAFAALGILALFFQLNGQEIKGTILDSLNSTPLEYASVGLVGTRYGCITNQQGIFYLEVPEQESETLIRISMIGYKSQSFALNELRNKDTTIKLAVDPIPIAELTITPSGEPYTVGTTKYTRLGNWCGWGGSRRGKGHEIGTKLQLGEEFVHVRTLHVHMHRQAYDTSWYRLHIRSLKDDKPDRELLNSNVILAIDQEKGWVELDLTPYNIVVQGDVALTLEWLKISGINEDRAMKINDRVTTEYILFNIKNKQGNIYTRWGVEANWNAEYYGSPAMYLTVQK